MDPSTASSPPEGQSPFSIPHEDIGLMSQSEGFQLLRRILANQASFCAQHSNCDKQTQDTWLLHRDMLHALTMPVVELFRRASALAGAALCTQKSEDLELAFAGEARGAFLWLQCFLSEAADWAGTKGCPACITIETLSTESHIRLTIAASLLSTASISSPNSSRATSTTSSPVSEDLPTQQDGADGLSLPPLPHILPALRAALDQDVFWGPMHWPYLFSRATQLSAGIQALITSCGDLDTLVSSPALDRPTANCSVTVPGLLLPIHTAGDEKGAKLKKSKLAERQLRMKHEEIEIMRRAALQCWAKAAVPSKLRNQLLGRDNRRRSLTCP